MKSPGRKNTLARQAAILTIGTLLCLFGGSARPDFVEYDDSGWSNEVVIGSLTAAGYNYFGLTALGLVPEPTVNTIAETAQYGIEIGLKLLPPVFTPPDPLPAPIRPNTPDECHFKFVMPLASAGFSNLLGFINTREHVLGGFTWRGTQEVSEVSLEEVNRIEACLDDPANAEMSPLRLRSACDLPRNNWGVLGYPRIFHLFSDASATVSSITGGIAGVDVPQVVYMPAGWHRLDWTATTEMNLVADILVPPMLIAVMAYTEAKLGKVADDIDELTHVHPNNQVQFMIEDDLHLDRIADLNRTRARWKWFNDWILGQRELNVRGFNIRDVLGVLGLDTPIQDLTIDNVGELLKESITTQRRFDSGHVEVYDVWPPQIALSQENFALEATDFGGVRFSRVHQDLRSAVSVSDSCGRDFHLRMSAIDPDTGEELPTPVLLPLGETTRIAWTVTDLGPNLPVADDATYPQVDRTEDGRYTRTVVQAITVNDTQPPLLLAPPSRVLETQGAPPEPGVNLADADLGNALVIDLADPEPQLSNDSPGFFPTDTRTTVTWSASDASGNRSHDEQLITVKAKGSNTPPSARGVQARTVTAEPVDIRLEGIDSDSLGGRFDPLTFRIEQPPKNGEFIAPLYPFFINDYRSIRPPKEGENDGGFYDAVLNKGVSGWIRDEICENDMLSEAEKRQAEADLAQRVLEPLYVHVLDDGTRYILDSVFECGSSADTVDQFQRISKWNKEEVLLGEHRLGPDEYTHDGLFHLGSDGNLYYAVKTVGDSTQFILFRCDTDFDQPSHGCQIVVKVTSSTFVDGELDVEALSSVVHDPDTGLTFVNDGGNIGILAPGGQMLGTLPEGYTFDDEFLDGLAVCNSVRPDPLPTDFPRNPTGGSILELGFSMTLDGEGNLYVADSCISRIHKFRPTRFDDDGTLRFGEQVGWMGRCTHTTNKACDVERQRSKGFSCTDETCWVDDNPDQGISEGRTYGSEAGQFNLPMYVDFDPNGLLYVADYFNFRVQRFGQDGTYAGEARSTTDGVVDPFRPSFVLGNMPAPRSLSVNSTQFFVTDHEEQFVHVFDTLPFKDVTDDSAVVTYVSNHDFHSNVDSFLFSVNDGLESSEPSEVMITVNRNFRHPRALPTLAETFEDQAVEFRLEADDPDGIAGEDFNGLDTLTWEVVGEPRNGELTQLENGWVRYQPQQDFFGSDRLRFRVNDGRFDSNVATASVEVQKLNDPPVVTFVDQPPEVGLGLVRVIKGTFTDDTNFDHVASIDWGDDTVDGPGGETVVDTEAETVEIVGVDLREPTFNTEGQTMASHVYETEGIYTINLCVRDGDGLEGCAQHDVKVRPLAEVTLGVAVEENKAPDGQPFPILVDVVAAEPTVGEGLVAENVMVSGRLDDQVKLLALGFLRVDTVNAAATRAAMADLSSMTPGVDPRCEVEGQVFHCNVASLAPGERARIGALAVTDGTLVFDGYAAIIADLELATPATSPIAQAFQDIDLLVDPTDTDGDGMTDVFETAFGLDPGVDDTEGDPDRDGLSNLREFEAQTDPTSQDTDGDRLTDGDEVEQYFTDPLNPDTDGDGVPDGLEIRVGLDPFVDDADRVRDGVRQIPANHPAWLLALALLICWIAWRRRVGSRITPTRMA